jgi:cytoskeletal protein CcmA (bactofilin family)
MSLFVRKSDEVSPARLDDAPVVSVAPKSNGTVAVRHAEEEACDYLGRGSRIQGKLRFEGSVRILGVVEGEIEATEAVMVDAGAEVSARITANVVLVRGQVNADVHARERLEIGASGTIRGKVTTAALVVHEGAVFEGACSMGGAGRREGAEKGVGSLLQSA